MKTTTIMTAVMVIFASATCLAGSVRIGYTPAARIARDMSIPGKGQAGQCLPFAQALQKKLTAAGIPAQVVVYGYESGGVPIPDAGGEIAAQPVLGEGPGRGSHAVVVYEDGGRTYVMDNQSWAPRWVRNAPPVQMAQQFSGINHAVKMARVLTEERAPKGTVRMGTNTPLAAN